MKKSRLTGFNLAQAGLESAGGYSGLFITPDKSPGLYNVFTHGDTPDNDTGNTIDQYKVNLNTGELGRATAHQLDLLGLYSADTLDLESIVIDNNSNIWLGDEYGPSIFLFDNNYKLLNRFIPENVTPENEYEIALLPEKYSYIKENKGFEAMAYDKATNLLYVFTQAPLDFKFKNPEDKKVKYSWLFAIDISQKAISAEYLIKAGKKFKISGACQVNNNQFLVIQRLEGSNTIQIVTINNATNMLNKTFTVQEEENIYLKKEFEGMPINTVKAEMFLSPAQLGVYGYDKLEGIAITSDRQLFLINDNDYETGTDSVLTIIDANRFFN